jgi:GH18 family chitinase
MLESFEPARHRSLRYKPRYAFNKVIGGGGEIWRICDERLESICAQLRKAIP